MRNALIASVLMLANSATAETVGFQCKVDAPYGAVGNNAGLNIGHTFTVGGPGALEGDASTSASSRGIAADAVDGGSPTLGPV
ncbi:MAG: hypothetical protein K9N23_14510 [Akkermansiaceae bacterium]|nr:hypothetical protein [Akkermansiaceae bacterium]MCF7732898.1 hypothetical protein [Akkermansiaceae bacterium]